VRRVLSHEFLSHQVLSHQVLSLAHEKLQCTAVSLDWCRRQRHWNIQWTLNIKVLQAQYSLLIQHLTGWSTRLLLTFWHHGVVISRLAQSIFHLQARPVFFVHCIQKCGEPDDHSLILRIAVKKQCTLYSRETGINRMTRMHAGDQHRRVSLSWAACFPGLSANDFLPWHPLLVQFFPAALLQPFWQLPGDCRPGLHTLRPHPCSDPTFACTHAHAHTHTQQWNNQVRWAAMQLENMHCRFARRTRSTGVEICQINWCRVPRVHRLPT